MSQPVIKILRDGESKAINKKDGFQEVAGQTRGVGRQWCEEKTRRETQSF